MKNKVLCFGLGLCLFSSATMAENVFGYKYRIGFSFENADVTHEDPQITTDMVGPGEIELEGDVGTRFFVGYEFSPIFGMELGALSIADSFEGAVFFSINDNVDYEYDATYLSANFSKYFNDRFFVRGKLGLAKGESELRLEPGDFDEVVIRNDEVSPMFTGEAGAAFNWGSAGMEVSLGYTVINVDHADLTMTNLSLSLMF